VQVKKASPKVEFKEISTMLGAKWKTVRAEEKKNLIRRYTMLRKKLICK